MCGINGFNWSNLTLIQSMNDSIRHRGPDGQGVYTDSNISLGHVRLSIQDLSEKGHQPMGIEIKPSGNNLIYSDSKLSKADLIIVFNGEIYNFNEIKTELSNYTFESTSDTEVILKAYLEWGFDCVNHFNGMWAFCIYDRKKNLFFCSRDRLGVKPFYYFFDDVKFVFSSELKGILKHNDLNINTKENINLDALDLYFSLTYIPAPYTIFQKVNKLEASQNLLFDLTQKKIIRKWYYYELPNYSPIKNKSKLIDEGREILNDAIKIRMRADVPVGAFLSGGLDSTSIVGNMRIFTDLEKLHTFSVGFSGKDDETNYMNIASKEFKTQHHHYYFTESDFQQLFKQYPYFYDEPFGDYSGFPMLFLSEKTKPFVTVVLTGDGGDEIFGGYKMYVGGARWDLTLKFIKIIPSKLRRIIARSSKMKKIFGRKVIKIFQMSVDDKKYYYSRYFQNDLYKPTVYQEWTQEKLEIALKKSNYSMAEAFRNYDVLFNTVPDRYNVKLDRATAAYALEARSPFLDYRFAEFAQKIPTKWKQDSKNTKKLMREIIRGMIPEVIRIRGKKGFHPPIDDWIQKSNYSKELEDSFNLLKEIHPNISNYYEKNVIHNDSPSVREYKILLILFYKWWKVYL